MPNKIKTITNPKIKNPNIFLFSIFNSSYLIFILVSRFLFNYIIKSVGYYLKLYTELRSKIKKGLENLTPLSVLVNFTVQISFS